ncbi:MAG TPA: ammonium transporter [Thermoplasmata archaeon]|nr:ammonium transporter [Thermoplasmata archaeon]
MLGDPVNNLWVLIAALLVFTMTIAVGLLEVGELGEALYASLLKTVLMTSIGLFVMATVGFNTAFAPTMGGVLGNPFYGPGFFLGSFAANPAGAPSAVWWSMGPRWFGTGLDTGTYFLFETAFAAVTLALVGVVVLRKMKPVALVAYSVVYFVIIWNLPAAWIWNPSGWLAKLGMVDFAGGLVVHGAAGAAGLGLLYQFWREERAKGLTQSPPTPIRVSPGWLTLAILLLWVGWFGFNPGSVLAFNDETTVVVLTTFLAAASGMVSVLVFRHLFHSQAPSLLDAVNGVLMGLIVITPVAGFVGPASAMALGLLGGPLFLAGENYFAKWKWVSDPVGLLPGHLLGGLFGVAMIAFFAQPAYSGALPAVASLPTLPAGLLFGGGTAALRQLGIELFGVVAVMVTVFVLSFLTAWVLARSMGGITTDYRKEGLLT